MTKLFFSLLLINGWQNDQRLTNDPNFTSTAIPNARCITVWDSTVHIVFTDLRNPSGIYYIRSFDLGNTWENEVPIVTGFGMVANAAIDNHKDTLHVVFQSRVTGNWDIYYIRSTDNGNTWTEPETLTSDPGDSYNPSIAVDTSGGVFVTFYDNRDGNLEIYFIRSTNSGLTWEPEKRLTNATGDSKYPSIDADFEGNIHVSFFDNRTGNFEVYYKRSTNRGISWEPEINISETPSSISRFTSVSADPFGGVHIVWEDSLPGNLEIFYRRSLDRGASWESPVQISFTPDVSDEPFVFADDSGSINVVWGDYPVYPSTEEIYFRGSLDRGATWGTQQRLTYAEGHKDAHELIVDKHRNVHVAWMDPRDGNYELYYKKGIPPYIAVKEKNQIHNENNLFELIGNPFSKDLNLIYLLSKSGKVSICIFDGSGKRIKVFNLGYKQRGRHIFQWNSLHKLKSGIYFIVLETGAERRVKKGVFQGGSE